VAIRFIVYFFVFTFGPGAACTAWLTQSLDTPRRVIIMLGVGVPASAVLIDILGRLGWLAAFPYVIVLSWVVAVAFWRPRRARAQVPAGADVWTGRDAAACAAILGVVIATGTVAFAHRVALDDGRIAVHGDYDSLDLAYYAAISAEASHTVPPTAPYYAGRELNYAYYPQLVLAMVHRFGNVSLLSIYFRYAWPAFLAVGSLTAFLLVRTLAPTGTALLAVVLLLIAGDFSYLAAWYLPHEGINWDYVLWPTNFLSPTMEVLHFNSWTPSLAIFFTLLWAIAHGFTTRQFRWLLLSGVLLGVLFQFKPFAFVVLSAALAASIVFAGRDWDARRRYATVLGVGVLSALPFVYRSIRLYADRRSELRLDYFVLPERMLIKLDLMETFTAWAQRTAPVEWLRQPIFLIAATALFLAVGLGIRWLAVPGVWRAVRGRIESDNATWRLLGWGCIAGVAIPFALVTEPYNDTLQFYQVGLYLLWIFTAAALMALARRRALTGAAVILVCVAVALPSSIHYLTRKWTDAGRPPLMGLTRLESEIASYLRGLDPQTTVVLHDRPRDPSLLAVMSARRIVLAWARYAVGSTERLREVEAFYHGTRTVENTLAILQKHNVTHVVVRTDRDRVKPEVLGFLTPVLGDDEVKLYEVPEDVRKGEGIFAPRPNVIYRR
jgi:hypothetical protein